MKIALYFLFLASATVFSQAKYITKSGQVNFEASVPSFEEVAAKNNSVTAILDSNTGEFAALAFINAFKFKNALMEEHFNENYAESRMYPKAIFKGQIDDFQFDNLSGSETKRAITGTLTFHGVTKAIKTIEVTLILKDGILSMSGKMSVYPKDYNIKIPKIVANKIANKVTVEFYFELVQQ
ncbi:MAG: YceI family protein [Gelidibacter sp.]